MRPCRTPKSEPGGAVKPRGVTKYCMARYPSRMIWISHSLIPLGELAITRPHGYYLTSIQIYLYVLSRYNPILSVIHAHLPFMSRVKNAAAIILNSSSVHKKTRKN